MPVSIVRSLRSVAFLAAVLVAGCGTFGETADETKDWSVSKLYSEARSELMGGNYAAAIKLYEKLEARYPYGRYAQQAQLEVAYAHYKEREPALSIAAADRFIKLHPNHPNVDYAYYLKGLANFNDDLGLMHIVSQQDLTERDPKAARDAFESFKDLVQRYPQSKYADDSRSRMAYLVNALASHEVHVARYYFKRGAYVAAANRAQSSLVTYPRAPANEEALLILVKAYDAMGLVELRNDAERVMKKNFPDSRYLSGNLSEKRPWWRLWW
jgi:outer membrane protein assembly factor BamD